MFGIIFRVALHLGSIYIGWRLGRKISKWFTKKQNEKKWNNTRKNLLKISARINDNYTDIKKVPQVSFERFLKLYEVSPEKWIITEDSCSYTEYFPIYVQGNVEIPLFWETGEDLQKYREWVKEKFAKGEAALYQQARDENMKLLTKFIKEDLERKRKRAEEEIAELEAQVKKECEQTKKKQKEIQLTLEPQTWSNTLEEATKKIKKFEIDSSGNVIIEEEVEPSNETSISQNTMKFPSTCIQPNQLDYNYICQIRDGLMQQIQVANMQAAQDYWLSQCQNSIMSQVQYNNIMQSIHPFHF